jgi:hypothetical protein
MKIVVIARTGRMRSQITERLRREGHNAVAAAPQRRADSDTGGPRDPGHAGRHLRTFLETTASILYDQWLNRRARIDGLRRLIGSSEIPGSASSPGRPRTSERGFHSDEWQAPQATSLGTNPSEH